MFCKAGRRECENPGGVGACGDCKVAENLLEGIFRLARGASDYKFKGEGSVAVGSFRREDELIINRVVAGERILPESSL